MKKKRFLNAAIRRHLSTGFVVLLTAAIFTLAGCGNTDGGPTVADADLSGTVTVIPGAGVTTGTLLTAYYYGGTEAVEISYQWKKGDANVGKNSNTYTPDTAGIHYVTISAAGYKSKTSAAIEVLASVPGEKDLSGTVSISPTTDVTVNKQLSAAYNDGTETVAFTYEWERGGTVVGTNSTYTPDQEGLYTVTMSAAGYKSKTSAAVFVRAAAGNIDPKSLYVIGITENYMTQGSEKTIAAVFPAGTALSNVKADLMKIYLESGVPQYVTAGADLQHPVKVGTTYVTSGPLHVSKDTPWTGLGTVDMYGLVSNGTSAYLYKVPNLLIQSAVTTVSLFDLEVALLGEIPVPQEPNINGIITLINIPANLAPGRIWINCSASKEGGGWWNESHGGNGVNFSAGNIDRPWQIKISDFVWADDKNDGKTDFFPAKLYFYVHFDGGDYDKRNYSVPVPAPQNIASEAEAVNIDLGVVNLDENKSYYFPQ